MLVHADTHARSYLDTEIILGRLTIVYPHHHHPAAEYHRFPLLARPREADSVKARQVGTASAQLSQEQYKHSIHDEEGFRPVLYGLPASLAIQSRNRNRSFSQHHVESEMLLPHLPPITRPHSLQDRRISRARLGQGPGIRL